MIDTDRDGWITPQRAEEYHKNDTKPSEKNTATTARMADEDGDKRLLMRDMPISSGDFFPRSSWYRLGPVHSSAGLACAGRLARMASGESLHDLNVEAGQDVGVIPVQGQVMSSVHSKTSAADH